MQNDHTEMKEEKQDDYDVKMPNDTATHNLKETHQR